MSLSLRISASSGGLLLGLLLMLLSLHPAGAQVAVRRDSSAFRPQELIAPGVLMTAGIGIHWLASESIDIPLQDDVQRLRSRWGEVPLYNYTFKYIPALPLAMDVGLGLLGAKAEHGFLDRCLEAGIATGLVSVSALAIKGLIDSPRPDGRDNNAFPSGHCCIAFVGAELVRMEYGWGWGAGAYAVATTVAALRVYHNRHYMSDLLMGAGMGILAAHAGRWLLEPTKRLLNPGVQVTLAPSVDPYSGTICAGLAMNF